MMNKKDIFEIIKIGLILFAITAVAGGILAAVNGLTAPIIAENAAKKQNEAMSKVMPEAESFERVEYTSDSSVTEVYACGKDRYVVLAAPKGYSGAISLVVGVNADGTVSAIDITGQSETAGLGSNCTKDEFKEQFVGKTNGIAVVKQGAKNNEIDAISSATRTSRAVTQGVNDALSAVESLKDGGVQDEK